MKNKFKLFIAGLGLIVLPLNTNAANYTLQGNTVDNVVKYDIKYVVDVANPETSEVTFKIEKEADNSSNLVYSIEKGNTVIGNCVNSDLSCTVKTADGAIAEGTVLATLTITNNDPENMLASFKINGYDVTKTYIEVPAKAAVTTKPKNTEATLSGIDLSLGTMDQTFNKDLTSYNITGIKDTINKIRVTPQCDNNCSWKLICPNGECSISDGTWINLGQGANQVSIIVESEDTRLTQTYVLRIYRGDIVLNSPYLDNLTIKNGTLSPKFDSMVNDYSIIVGLDVDKLDIEALPQDPSANVLIKGNENLKVGENTITITVTSTDGQNKQVYTIKVTKEELNDEKKEDKKHTTTKVNKKKDNTILIIILSILGLGFIIAAYFIIFKIKKNKKNKAKDNKNDKNNKNKPNEEKNNTVKEDKEKDDDDDEVNEDTLLDDMREKTTQEKIEEITKEIVIPNIDDEPKQDVDEALDDLMKTKQIELGDLDF